MKTKNKIIIAISVVLVLAIIAVVLSIYNKNKQEHNEPEDVVVLKENVIVITDEIDNDLQPYKVDENHLYFKKNPEYNKNDVVVSGMTKAAPNGYIRRIIKTEELNGEFVVETEPATFLDVFEELHIDRTFTLIKGKQSPTIETQSIKTDAINISSLTKTEKENNFSIKESSDKDLDELFKVEFDGDLCEEIHIEGETTVKLWLNTKIDIDDGHITWEMTANDEVNGNILLGYSASVEDEYTKELFDAQLPNIQFMAGPVPIVITNEVSADLNVEGEIEGKIGTEIEINKSDKAGFIYTSKTNKVEDITSQKFTDGGIEWNSGTSVEVATSAGVEIGLTSLFYDCSGADISVGVAGDIDGKATLSTVDTTEEPLEGKIALSIYPYLQGGIVVEVPVIDNQLVELSLFELELKPFWEKVWDTNSKDTQVNVAVEDYSNELWWKTYERIIQNIKNAELGGFGFTELVPAPGVTLGDEHGAGRGGVASTFEIKNDDEFLYCLKEINKNDNAPELILARERNNDIQIIAIYDFSINSASTGISNVMPDKYKDFVLLCTDGSIYHEYEWGDKEIISYDSTGKELERDYNETTDKSKLIKPEDMTWISIKKWESNNSTTTTNPANITTTTQQNTVTTEPVESTTKSSQIKNYTGLDWVAQENFCEEIGDVIISGTGKKYTVISRENNFDSGGCRYRVVLLSETNQKMVIGNLPNFYYDEPTGITYFNINEYHSNPNYKEY